MATGAVTRNANGIANRAVGKATGDGTPLSVAMGFRPMAVKVINMTAGKVIEKLNDMTDEQALIDGAVDTSSAIVLTERGFILSAAQNAADANLVWYAD